MPARTPFATAVQTSLSCSTQDRCLLHCPRARCCWRPGPSLVRRCRATPPSGCTRRSTAETPAASAFGCGQPGLAQDVDAEDGALGIDRAVGSGDTGTANRDIDSKMGVASQKAQTG